MSGEVVRYSMSDCESFPPFWKGKKIKKDKKKDMYCGSPGKFDIPADVQ